MALTFAAQFFFGQGFLKDNPGAFFPRHRYDHGMDQETIFLSIVICLYVAGFVAGIISLFQARTPQGAAAWLLALLTIPLFSLPVFIAFGKRKLKLYGELDVRDLHPEFSFTDLEAYFTQRDGEADVFFKQSEHPFVTGNHVDLLQDGEVIFSEMKQSIDQATNFILLQMYIFRADSLGQEMAELLAKKAEAGIRVYILYDNFTLPFSRKIKRRWKEAGVNFGRYDGKLRSMFHLNFRNHRKLLLIDGREAYFGGVNIGDDYLGKHPDVGHWRDTNTRVFGPSVSLAQLAFAKDWFWAMREKISVDWSVPDSSGPVEIVVLNADPSEELAFNLLEHIELIHSAKSRLWIANPYIVPPQGLMDALIMARLRDVEVRILVPSRGDNPLVRAAAPVYYERLLKCGVKLFYYPQGMMHQKVMLVDQSFALVGSSNLDFRSMFINFENGILGRDPQFVEDVSQMLTRDFQTAKLVSLEEIRSKPFLEHLQSRIANVLTPIL